MRPIRPTFAVQAVTMVTALWFAASACALTSTDSDKAAGGDKTIQIAYLSASSANTWLASARDAMEEEGRKNNAEITEFDAKFEPGAQAKQIQDIIASGQYEGIIIASVDGVGVAPALTSAIDAGLEVVVLNQVVGEDLDTADPQVDGVAASVLAPPQATGERLGELTVQACEGESPCEVVYLYGGKGTPYDTAVRSGWDSKVSSNPDIKVIAEGESGFLGTDEPRKAMQDILQSNPDFNVLVGTSDQAVRGALLALADGGKSDVKTIGVGGSTPALAAMKDGTWFADVAGAPADEGRMAFQAMIAAVREDKDLGGIDVTTELPNNGLITQDNVDEFTAQWEG